MPTPVKKLKVVISWELHFPDFFSSPIFWGEEGEEFHFFQFSTSPSCVVSLSLENGIFDQMNRNLSFAQDFLNLGNPQ